MTKSISFLFAASMLFLTTACDPADEPTTERSAEIDSEEAKPCDDEGKRGDHGKFAVDKLCSELECNETQVAQITELFASMHEGRGEKDHEAHKAARDAANKVLADAFRADTFDVSVLERQKPERDGDHAEQMIEFATGLHTILTPEQRTKLADKIADGGPMFFMGHGGPHKGPRGDGPRGEGPDGIDGPKGDPSERHAKHVEQLCEKVTCTDDQKAQLTEVFTAAHEARKAAKDSREEPDFTAVADLLRADTLDAAKLRETIAAGKVDHEQREVERDNSFGSMMAEVHAILTPEQRGVVADLIEDKGMRALMGGKHGKHGKGGKKDRGDKDRGDNRG